MKLKHLLPICALALPLCAQAVPAYPGLVPATMADGTQTMIRMHGDEFFNYTTDEQGYLLTGDGKGRLVYKCDPNGARLKATPMVLEQMRVDAIQALNPEMQQRALARGVAAEANGPQRIAPHDNLGRTTFPTLGDNHYLVLLVDYPDLQWSVSNPTVEWQDMLNGDHYDYRGSVGSMRDYYIKNSGGLLTPTFDIVGVVRMPKTNAYYVGSDKFDNIQELVTTACQLASENYGVDFSKYDIDEDGNVDNVIIFYPGYGAADESQALAQGGTIPCIWPHNSSVASKNVVLNGKKLGNYCCFNELKGGYRDGTLNGLGTPVHEFGHVLGLPDLYDPDYKVAATPAKWSVMDQGCYNGSGYIPCNYSSYERWCLKWTEYDLLEEPGEYTLQPISQNGRALRQNVLTTAGSNISNEYYLFESRHREDFDSALPYGGMLIWHINYDRNAFVGNRVNNTFSNQRCHLITADGTASYALNNTKESGFAAWPQSINFITPDTEITLTPYTLTSGRKPLPHYYTNIAFDSETGESSFSYDVISGTPELTTVLKEPYMVESETGRRTNTLHLEWDEVPGADSYQLTMFRLTSSGTPFYESLLNEKNVGNVTSYELNLTSDKLTREFHAYVRPVQGIPSSKTSNELIFTPNLLSQQSAAVDAIEADFVPVRGLQGAIDAPASARVFTLTGAACGRENLAPGIYMVNYAGKTYKVIVK